MAFNSDTYHANKARRLAKAGIARARDIKARAAKGEAYEWEVAQLPTIVSGARLGWHLYLMYRGFARMKKESRK